jgi:hypothetical protein
MRNSIIHNKLDKLQFNSNIETGKFLIVKIEPGGFGAEVYRRLLGLKLGYIFNRTVIFDYSFTLYENCFHPLSSFDFSRFSLKTQTKLNFKQNQQDKIVYFDFYEYWNNFKLRKYIENWTPKNLNKNQKPNYFLGQLTFRLIPLPEYKKYLNDCYKRLHWQRPIIGCHIRRGDKNVESPYVPLRIYHHHLNKAINKTGVKRIFITSDSPDIFSKLPQIKDVEYIYDNQEKRYNNANHQLVKNNKDLKKQETMTSLKILTLLSSCDYLVGQVNTHFTNLAAANLSAQDLKGHTYFVNRKKGDISLNNDPNLIFYLLDIAKKYSHIFLQKTVQIFLPSIKKSTLYIKIKEHYYGRKLD